ncbi:MAG: hypothetical protein WCW33_04200 [Candidatus Babeliales bacterium]|jgi:hypothetical protein
MRYLQMIVAMAVCGVMVQGCFAALPVQEKATSGDLVARNWIGMPVKIGQFGGKLEGFESVDKGASIVIRPDTTQLVFGDSGTKAVTPSAGSDECNKQKAGLEQQLQSIATQMSDINQQAIKLQAQLDALRTPKQKELEKQLLGWQQEYDKIVAQRGKTRRGTVQDYALQRSQDDLEQRMMNLRQQQLEPLKTQNEKELEKQLQDFVSSPYFPTNKIGRLEFQQRRIQVQLDQLSAKNLVITNNLEIRIMMSRDGQPGVRGIPQGTSIYEPLGPGGINFSEDRLVTIDLPGPRAPRVGIPEIPRQTILQKLIQSLQQEISQLTAQLQTATSEEKKKLEQAIHALQEKLQKLQEEQPTKHTIPTPKPLPATPLSPEDENVLINKLQTDTKHETLLEDILRALDVTPTDAAKLGTAVKAAFERLVIMQQQPNFRTSFSWNLNALADRIHGKFNIEVSPDEIKKAAQK